MVTGNVTGTSMTPTVSVGQKLSHLLSADVPLGLVLGPLVGLLIWGLPLEIEPAVHKAFAIVILFVGGVFSMATVLKATQALDVVVAPCCSGTLDARTMPGRAGARAAVLSRHGLSGKSRGAPNG